MRVTRESLIRIAKETAQERAYNDKNIIAAYLIGSLLTEDPLLGGVTDIDLVLVTANSLFYRGGKYRRQGYTISSAPSK